MTPELLQVLKEEQSVFKYFDSFSSDIPNFYPFHSPGIEEVAHWNMVYPQSLRIVPSNTELKSIVGYYSENQIIGHLPLTDDKWKEFSKETDEYFIFKGGRVLEPDIEMTSTAKPDNDQLDKFCSIIQEAFNLSGILINYFHEKMKKLADSVESKFWLVSYKNEICGCEYF